MIALTQEKREELIAFVNASIEKRCTVYTLAKQRELEALRDQVALASLTAKNINAKSSMYPGCKFPVIKIESLEFLMVGSLEDAESIACELSDLYISPPVPEIKFPGISELVDYQGCLPAVRDVEIFDFAISEIKRLNGLGD